MVYILDQLDPASLVKLRKEVSNYARMNLVKFDLFIDSPFAEEYERQEKMSRWISFIQLMENWIETHKSPAYYKKSLHSYVQRLYLQLHVV